MSLLYRRSLYPIWFLVVACRPTSVQAPAQNPGNIQPALSIQTQENNIARLEESFRAIVNVHLGPESKPACQNWSGEEQDSFIKNLIQSEKNTDFNEGTSVLRDNLAKTLAEACAIAPLTQSPMQPSIIIIKAIYENWVQRQEPKATLLTSLRAKIPAMTKIRTLLAIDGETKDKALVQISLENFMLLSKFIAILAQADKFVRLFPNLLKLFKQKHPNVPSQQFEFQGFEKWIKKRLSADPNTKLLDFSEDLLVYETDPATYLNMTDLISTSDEIIADLAKLVYQASNAFVLRGHAPNEYSLRNVVKTSVCPRF